MKKLIICLAILFAQFGIAQEETTPEIKDALKLMKLSNATVESSLQPIYSQIPEENLEAFKQEMQPVLDEMYLKLAKVAAEQYSHEDIKALLDFYETDLGKTMLEGQEEIFQASMQIGQEFSMELMPILQKYMEGN